jgi:hypothetical protein
MGVVEKLGRNDLCHCGSEKKYKKCHLTEDLLSERVYYKKRISSLYNKNTLNQNTLDFIEFLKEVLLIKVNKRTGTLHVEGSVTKEKVKHVYEMLPYFFPHSTPFKDLCYDLSQNPFSGFYWGNPDINAVSSYIARYALYTSHIIITNPFCDMMIYHDTSPIEKPEAWKQITMNQALFLVSIEQWIREEIITVLPPLKWFDLEMDQQIVQKSEKRINTYSEDILRELHVAQYMDMVGNFRPEHIESFLKQSFEKEVPPDAVKAFENFLKREIEKNPLRYKWDVSEEGNSTIIKTGSGNSLEAAMFTSQLCDSYILFGEQQYRKQYDIAIDKTTEFEDHSLSKLSRAFAELDFSFLNAVRLDFIFKERWSLV